MNITSSLRTISFALLCIPLVTLWPSSINAHQTGMHTDMPLINKSLYQIPNMIRVPLTRQATPYTCGVAALQSILHYYGDEYNEKELELKLHSNSKDGTSYHDIIAFARQQGYTANAYQSMTIETLKQNINNGVPILVTIQAWRDNAAIHWKDAWDDGHYVVVIGYDKENIYFMDPSVLGYYAFIPIKEFLTRWHDEDKNEKLIHFGLIITKDKPVYDPTELAYIE